MFFSPPFKNFPELDFESRPAVAAVLTQDFGASARDGSLRLEVGEPERSAKTRLTLKEFPRPLE